MNCSDYMASVSDHLDGLLSAADAAAFQSHREGCSACHRYALVLEQGSALLRRLPEPELSEDFVPRLQHQLYHVDDQVVDSNAASATPALSIVGMALLLTAIAWAPAILGGAPVVVLEPIVVQEPPRAPTERPVNALPTSLPAPTPLTQGSGLFDDGSALFYEYSPLSQRYRRRAAVRSAGLQRDR